MLRKISSCVGEACIVKGGNAVYEDLANPVRADQCYGPRAKKEQGMGCMFGCRMEVRKYTFLTLSSRCLLVKKVYSRRCYW